MKFLPPSDIPALLGARDGERVYRLPSSGQHVPIQRYAPRLERWTGAPISYTYGGKPIVSYSGSLEEYCDKAHFAELRILRAFEELGWKGGWIDTWGSALRDWTGDGHSRFLTGFCDALHPARLPTIYENLLRNICEHRGAKGKIKGLFCGGAFDVFCWRSRTESTAEIVFLELKGPGDDVQAGSQPRWVEAALRANVPVECFYFVEWRF